MNLLAIDVGNTTISFGLMSNQKVIKRFSILTQKDLPQLKPNLTKILKEIKSESFNIEKAIICSVVPSINKFIKSEILKTLKVDVHLVGEDIVVPIVNLYKNPKAVGQDRLVAAFAAKEIVGPPAIVIDLGTAITFDVVSNKGAYEGGLIVPGIRLSAEALYQKTALLPQITNFKSPSQLIGKTTEESILSGIFNGYAEMCNGLVERLTESITGSPAVIITGGYASLMKKHFHFKCYNDPDLLFKGLASLLERLI